ncbi:MAG: hypothetical protein FWE58_03510 [Methanobrevibacter sp.]|nr:hypothetical protein [Methanobrevibacter sp.]
MVMKTCAIDSELADLLKIESVKQKTTMKNLLNSIVKDYLDLNKEYDCEAFKKSINDAEASEGITLDVDELEERYKIQN